MKTIKFKGLMLKEVLTCLLILCLLPSVAFSQKKASVSNAKFLQEASISGMDAVAMGNLGQKRLQNEEVKEYALKVLNLHMVANAELKALAKKKSIKLPDSMTIPFNSMQTRTDTTLQDTSKKIADNAQTVASDDGQSTETIQTDQVNFDEQYIQMMIDDHKKAIALFEKGSASSDRDIKAYATKYLGVFKKHLSEATSFQKTEGAKPN